MKKIAAVLLAVILMAVPMFTASAATENRVFADEITAKASDEIDVVVKIENNTGFMGFDLVISYDSNVLTPVSASSGSVIRGLFNDSIENAAAGSFRVTYSGTENMTENGTIFTLKFKVNDNASGSTSVKIEGSSDDVFDESYENVTWNIERINITIGNSDENGNGGNNNPVTPDDPSDGENDKLSVRIRKWAAGLVSPLNSIMSIIVAPIAFVISLFE